jgi:DNA-binding transcriptional MocR family regulator
MLEGGHNALRLAYAAVTPDQAREGVRLLTDALVSVAGPAARQTSP